MATSSTNPITQGFSGKFGNIVFRQCNGRSIISCAPRKSGKRPTEKQVQQRYRFKNAARYAKAIMADPEALAVRTANMTPGESVYQYLVKEYLNSGKE